MAIQPTKEIGIVKNKFALLIGVEKFTDKTFTELRGVGKDIRNFGKILNDRLISEFQVTSLVNPSFVDTRKAISELSEKAQADDVIFFYYSGHGAKSTALNSLYLILKDSEAKYLDATCLESEYILSQFRKSQCHNIILIIDCCHSGAFFNNHRGLPKGLFALTACDENQMSFETETGGHFTNIIISGLKSDYIDANRDGKITFSELFDYIIEESKFKGNPMSIPQKWEWNVTKDIVFFDSPKLVFISYKRQRLKFVKKLSKDLKEAEIPTFTDLEKLRIGDNWKKELEKTIKDARVFLFILDKNILFSEVSMWELAVAKRNKIPILPIQVEDVKIPAMFQSEYGHINRLFFSDQGYEHDLATLVKHIKSYRTKIDRIPKIKHQKNKIADSNIKDITR